MEYALLSVPQSLPSPATRLSVTCWPCRHSSLVLFLVPYPGPQSLCSLTDIGPD